MATRKNKPEATGGAAYRAFTVVLENIQGDFRAFGEQLGGFGQRLDRMDGRLDRIESDLEVVKTDLHVVKIDLHVVKTDLDVVKIDLGLVKTAVLEHNTLLKDTVRRDEVEALVDRAVARRSR